VEIVGDREYVLDGAAEAVEFPDAQGCRRPAGSRGDGQAGPLGFASGDLFLEDAAAASLAEGVVLQLGVLAAGGDTGRPDQVVMGVRHRPKRLINHLRISRYPGGF